MLREIRPAIIILVALTLIIVVKTATGHPHSLAGALLGTGIGVLSGFAIGVRGQPGRSRGVSVPGVGSFRRARAR